MADSLQLLNEEELLALDGGFDVGEFLCGIGGGCVGGKIGAAIGSAGGPIGTVVGGIVGVAVYDIVVFLTN